MHFCTLKAKESRLVLLQMDVTAVQAIRIMVCQHY